MMERMRRRRRPDWSMWMFGWHNIFRQEVVGGMSVKLNALLILWAACGSKGVQQ